eukprot:56557-Chlamydomonas_euryale.AAC.1
MGQHYSLVKSVHMGQIRLLLFARNDVCAAISRIDRGAQVPAEGLTVGFGRAGFTSAGAG